MREVSEFTNYQLYKKVRSIIVGDMVHNSNRERMLERIYRECKRRSTKIYDLAVQDALFIVEDIPSFEEEYQVAEIKKVIMYHDSSGELVAAAGIHQMADPKTLEDLEAIPYFQIKINGDSMIEVEIQPNSWVLAEQTDEFHDLNVCLLNLEGEQLVKTLSQENGKWWAYSENKNYPPVPLEHFTWEVQGVVKYILSPVPTRFERAAKIS